MDQNEKNLIVSFIHFLREKISSGQANDDQSESLEVAIQCIEAAFSLSETDYTYHPSRPLPQLFASAERNSAPQTPTPTRKEPTETERARAELLKNEGNQLMRDGKALEAVTKYTEALGLHQNAIFYCNRAAAYSKMEDYGKAIDDCRSALALDRTYSKAYGRMGLALSCQNRYQEAADAYEEALKLEPANESFKNNLEIAKQKLVEGNRQQQQQQQPQGNPFGMPGGLGGMDLGSLLNNPAMMQMAQQMFSNPQMQNMMSNMMGGALRQDGSGGGGGGQGFESLLRAGQQLASQMQQMNPDLVEELRRTAERGNPPDQPPPGDGSGGDGGGSNGK